MLYLTYSVFFFKQKTAYEMRISDWSSDVCSSDLMVVVAKPLDQAALQLVAPLHHVCQQVVAADGLLHRKSSRGSHGMAHVGVAVLEEARALRERFENLAGQQHRADRLVAAAEALGDGHEVGRDAVLLAGMQGAGAPHAAPHLVEDEQHAVLVADPADALAVVGHRRPRTGGRADPRQEARRVGKECVSTCRT